MRTTNWTKIIVVTTLCLFLLNFSSCVAPEAQREAPVVSQPPAETTPSEEGFVLAKQGETAVIYVDSEDWAGVVRAASDLQSDINRVTGQTPKITHEETGLGKNAVIIGTIGKSKIIDQLIKNVKIDTASIDGKWESYIVEVVPEPLPGVENALVIVGSDKRGTIYGIYHISEYIGVSPWYWWADVPAEHKDNLFVKAGKYIEGPPAVKYRGIFINDEGWALAPWVREKFGGFNSEFYTKVFELLLRLKANYMWPAMWGNAFNEDDPNNPILADEYGIVMGNSHQEPMLRAQKEWDRRYGKPWDYWTDTDNMQKFWREGVKRNKNYESIISMGLRGANDSAMSKNKTVQECAEMLEKIIDVQRKIIAEEVNPDVTKVPQLWCPYKEAQEYYEKGAKIPDDITILWCDDNWGNIRRLPTEQERKRSGGAGIYYHFDFHGGPRSYEWLNTSPIPKVWEQLHLAYRYEADRIWIVNVGDLKPMEFPISFFIDYGWNPDKWPAEKLPEYTKDWAEQQFGPEYAEEIADILTKYTKYNGRRKPESLGPDTYSLSNYREAETVVAEYNEIAEKAEKIYKAIPAEYKDAYYELVMYPVSACANLNELYLALGKNLLYAKQGRAATNEMADKVKELYEKDAEITNYYDTVLADGKWDHLADTTHIGYTSWNPPPKNIMPEVNTIELPNYSVVSTLSTPSTPSITCTPGAPNIASLEKTLYLGYVFICLGIAITLFFWGTTFIGPLVSFRRFCICCFWLALGVVCYWYYLNYTSKAETCEKAASKVTREVAPKVASGISGEAMGVAIEGSDSWWPMDKDRKAILPEFDPYNQQKYYIEVFNRGQTPFDYKIESAEPWLLITPNQGKIDKQQRVWVSVDWQKAPAGKNNAAITITGPNNKQVVVNAPINNPSFPKPEEVKGFVEGNGYVSIEAEHYSRAVESPPIKWLLIPDLGRTDSGMTPVPVTSESQKPEGDSPRLEYSMYLFDSGPVEVKTYLSPTENFLGAQGLRYAVSFDDQTPQIINIHENETVPDWKYPPYWNQAVMENIKITTSEHTINEPGEHTLKFWMVDPGIVLQKIVIDAGGVKPSYLGPPESYRR
jgi:hypothetical protein